MPSKIKRAELVRLLKDYKLGKFEFLSSGTNFPFQTLQKVYIENNTGSRLDVGSAVRISGLANSGNSFEKMFTEYATVGFWLSCITYSSSHTEYPVAYALEPIKTGKVGEVMLPSISAAIVSGWTSSKKYGVMKGNVLTAKSSGDFYIIGVSDENSDGNRFCYVVPEYTEAEESGHLIGYVSGGAITGPSSKTSVTVCDGIDCGSGSGNEDADVYTQVRCPLLRSSETIKSGTIVVISKNLGTKDWEIIEAQCPEDED